MGCTKDGGIDIIAVRRLAPDVEFRMLVQCKRHKRDKRVEVGVVKEVWATKLEGNFHQAMIATSSTFTRGAIEKAQTWQLTLKDHKAIVGWCREYGTRHS
jgi:HJR/Mrr/RecB family endonuclease